MKGEFTFAWQREQRVLYAKVVVEIFDSTDSEWHLDVTQKVSPGWKSGAHFGLELFLERISRAERQRSRLVKIVEIDGQPCDTTVSVIAFAAFFAIENALKIETNKPPQFIEDEGRFVF